MSKLQMKKKAWATPQLAVYGSVQEITQQTKNKKFGPGDDVLVCDQAILASCPPGTTC